MAHRADRTGAHAPASLLFSLPPAAGRLASLAPLVALAGLMWLPALAPAQEPPGEAPLGAALASELPAWWSIRRVEVRASINDGDAVEPRWRQHFLADAVSAEALYISGGETVGPFEVLIPTRTTGETHRLYGVARSRLKLGEWITEVVLENSVDGLGEPRSLFARPVVVAGSEEAEWAAASLLVARELAGTAAESVARTAVDADALHRLAEEAAAALETANRERVNALRARYEEERTALAAAGERERVRVEQEHRSRLEALQASLAEMTSELEAMPTATETESAALVARNRERLDTLRAQYEEERAAVEAGGERERAALEEEHRSRLETLQADLAEMTAESEAMPAAAEAEQAALVTETRTRLDALQSLQQQDLAEISNSGERERSALKEEARARLEALKARLAEESAETKARLAAVQTEQTRLVKENEEALDALRAQSEAERAAATATPETLLALSEAEAEAAAQRELVPILEALVEQGKRVAATAAEDSAADLSVRTAWYGALLDGLGSDVIAERHAALNLALASDDEGLRAMAFVLALVSGDEELKSKAIDTALASEHKDLEGKAIEFAFVSDDEELKSRAIEITLASNDKEMRSKAIYAAFASDNKALRAKVIDLIAGLPRISQWASRVVDFSSEADGNQSARAALGSSTVGTNEECRGGFPSWYPGTETGEQFVRVAFAKPVLFPDVVVYETGNDIASHGFVRKLIFWDSDGSGTVYPVQDELRHCPGASRFNLRQHTAPVAEVTVVIDPEHAVRTSGVVVTSGSEGIDAIELIGTPIQ